MKNYGLLPLKEDKRDFPLGSFIKLASLDTIPENFRLNTLPVRHQKDSDFCTQFTFCEISGQQEGVELEPAWSFAMSKSDGDYNEYGSNLRDAAKPHVKIGAIEKTESPYSLENKPHTFLRNPEVWPVELIDKAVKHKKKTYFKVTGQYDHFDNIRASIYAQKSGVAIGVMWDWDMKDKYIITIKKNGMGHALAVVGWEHDYLIVKQSYGESVGDKGFHYIHRDVINYNVDIFGAFMLTDMPREEVENTLNKPENEQQEVISDILDMIISLLQKLRDLILK